MCKKHFKIVTVPMYTLGWVAVLKWLQNHLKKAVHPCINGRVLLGQVEVGK